MEESLISATYETEHTGVVTKEEPTHGNAEKGRVHPRCSRGLRRRRKKRETDV